MDLNAFPDVVLRRIFHRIPLPDLVRHIPLVCHRWHFLQTGVLAQSLTHLTLDIGTDARRNLIDRSTHIPDIPRVEELVNEDGSLAYPPNATENNKFCALRVTLSILTDANVEQFVLKCKKVNYLELNIWKNPTVSQAVPLIIRLLSHLGPGLKTLKIRCKFSNNLDNDDIELPKAEKALHSAQLQRLLSEINITKLPILEHLTLNLWEDLQMDKESPLDFPILAQLREFYFISLQGSCDYLYKSLHKYAESNANLESIGLGNDAKFEDFIRHFGQGSRLASRFKMLPNIDLKFDELENKRLFKRRITFMETFNQLTTLEIHKGLDMPFDALTQSLAPLQNLLHLFITYFECITSYDKIPKDEIVPLPSIRILTLSIDAQTHRELKSKYWTRIWPNLQILTVNQFNYGCYICAGEEALKDQQLGPCVRRLLLPLKQNFRSRTLKKIYYLQRGDEDTMKEFTLDMI